MLMSAIRDVLKADSDVTNALATYDFGNGAEAAIHTTDPLPGDANYPAIVLTLVGGNPAFGTREKRGAEADVDIRIYEDKTGSTADLRTLGWDVWEAVHRATLTITGYEELGVVARPPITAPDPDGFPGLRISTTTRILEE